MFKYGHIQTADIQYREQLQFYEVFGVISATEDDIWDRTGCPNTCVSLPLLYFTRRKQYLLPGVGAPFALLQHNFQ